MQPSCRSGPGSGPRSRLRRPRFRVWTGRDGSALSSCIHESDVQAAFVRRRGKQRRVRCGESLATRHRRREGDAVGKRERAARTVVVACMESTRKQTDCLVRGDDLKASERQPADLLLDVGRRPALVADQDVEHFADVDRADARRVAEVAQQNLDFARGRLARQRCHDRMGIENAQRRPL
jgi:hypothetical protein